MDKYSQVAQILRQRILHGDYTFRELPTDRALAEETGVSYMTARRAVQDLLDDGLVVRGQNRRLEVNRNFRALQQPLHQQSLQVALISPDYPSRTFERWRVTFEKVIARTGNRLRPVHFVHWDDPQIIDAIEGFDGAFLLPSSEPMPPTLVQRLKRSGRPLVMLENDMSHLGLPVIQLFPPVVVQRLLDHLESIGCRHIACLNVQPTDAIVTERITQWQIWMDRHGFHGPLINKPVEPYYDPMPQAYAAIEELLASGNRPVDALLCTTTWGAMGVLRAFYDAGIQVGTDIAVASVDGEGLAAFQVPSITALEPADADEYIETCLRWMTRGGKDWIGSLLLKPDDFPLIIRESTKTFVPQSNRSS